MTVRLVVRAVHGFDGERPWDGGAAVFVEDGRITGVETMAGPVPQGWPVADFPHATVLPGLIDMHVHLCGDGGPNALERLPRFGDDELAAVIDGGLHRQLAGGVTTVRDLGDRRWAVLEQRDKASPGLPTIVASGPPITSVGGHCWHMGGEVAGTTQIRAAVRERAHRRADVVKVMASGGRTTPGTDVLSCQFSRDELRVLVDEAHAAGLPVTAHAHGLSAIEQALAAGADGIEHCSFLTESGPQTAPQIVEALARQRAVVCPTLGMLPGPPPPGLVAFLARAGLTPQAGMRARAQTIQELHRHGVTLVAGSDAGIDVHKPHGILPRTVAALLDSGVPITTALASATTVAARHCGLAARKGRLHPGLDADLLLVDGDLLTDATALQRVIAVMIDGQWVIGQPEGGRERAEFHR